MEPTNTPTVPGTEQPRPPWMDVAAGTPRVAEAPPLNLRRLVWRLILGACAVLVVVGAGSVVAASQLAEREAVNDAANTADVLAEAVIQPALTDQLLTGDPAAVAAMDQVVRRLILGPNIVRVKLWSPDGVVLYADEPALIGRQFTLSADQRAALADPIVRAEVSELTGEENVFEQRSDKLLEVYRPVWTPSGHEVLFEIYAPYDPVQERAADLWRGLAGLLVSSLLLLVVLIVPILWRVFDRLATAQEQRETLLRRSVDASLTERRRIAGTLHDGPVQELAGAAFTVAAAAQKADAMGHREWANDLGVAAAALRTSIGGLRSLLVELYPPSLLTAGLGAALADLANQTRARGVAVNLHVDEAAAAALDEPDQRLVHRVVQECLRNVVKHAPGATVNLRVAASGPATVVDLADDGPGFDPTSITSEPEDGHVGLRVLRDLAAAAGATLRLATAPGRGTAWQLIIAEEAS